MKNTQIQLHELTPADQAKSLGLVYGGFGGWIDPKTRQVKARTVDGKLVRVDDEENGGTTQTLGKLNIFVLDHNVMKNGERLSKKYTDKYNKIIQSILKHGDGEMIILIEKNTEREVADYLRKIGISGGLKLTPIDATDPNKIRAYVEKKIKAGHNSIQYYDTNETNINAVESLRAPYNKLDLSIDTHPLTKIERN